MRPTTLATAILFIAFAAIPATTRADCDLADELMDSTHDLRAKSDLTQETIPDWEAPVADSWSVINGGSPFTQGARPAVTIDDEAPGMDIGVAANFALLSLEDVAGR